MKFKFSHEIKAYIYLSLAAAIWGIAVPVIANTLKEVPPFSFLAIRFALAGLFAIPMAIYTLTKIKINKTRLKHILIGSVLGHVVALSLGFIGLERSTAISASMMYSLSPLVLVVLAWLILREHIRKNQIEGFLVAFIGTLILIIEPAISNGTFSEIKRLSLVGNILIVIGMCAEAMYNIYVKRYLSHDKIITPFRSIVLMYCFAISIFLPLGLLEQFNLYNASANRKITYQGETVRYCKVADYDLGTYTADVKCDDVGCYFKKLSLVSSIDKEYYPPDVTEDEYIKEYFCSSQAKNDESFFAFLSHNIQKYLNLKNSLSIGYMAFFSGLLAYILFSLGLKHISASKASVFYYLQGVFAIPVSIIFLKEKVSLIYLFGAALIIIGVIMAERHKRKNLRL